MPFNYLLTISFNAEPALKLTTFLASICNGSLVKGLIPSLAALSEILKFPNPATETSLPLPISSLNNSKVSSYTFVTSALHNPVLLANASIISDFFIF